jgi:hypothetical protein
LAQIVLPLWGCLGPSKIKKNSNAGSPETSAGPALHDASKSPGKAGATPRLGRVSSRVERLGWRRSDSFHNDHGSTLYVKANNFHQVEPYGELEFPALYAF